MDKPITFTRDVEKLTLYVHDQYRVDYLATPDDLRAAGYISIETVRAWLLRIDYAAPYGSNAQTIARSAVKALDDQAQRP